MSITENQYVDFVYQHIDFILKQVGIKTYLEMKGCAKIAQLMR